MTNSDSPNYATIGQFLDEAIQFEIDSAQFYRDLKSHVDNREAEQLLDLLEREERDHERKLREWKSHESSREMIQFPPSLKLSMPKPGSEHPDFDELIDVAIRREHRSAEIYRKTAERVRGEFRELLEGLAVFEQKHEERVKSLRDWY